jgi:hypothetical protein
MEDNKATLAAWLIALLAISVLFDGNIYADSQDSHTTAAPATAQGVCPPFRLRDESGKEINPVTGINSDAPYSPKQTCGGTVCHDYAKITEGFHFTQGKGDSLPQLYKDRYQWVSYPGNYGGNWCSPAPLYRALAPKENTSARTIDMTSFDFVTATCGNCHPGGGPMEFDRNGLRYDKHMLDSSAGLISGGENGLDGDYYKARWSETGVLEADCLLCHMPEYDYKKRNAELANLNFRWAATAGAGFGTIKGTVTGNEQPVVSYDPSKFDPEGNVILHIAPEPRNQTCLNCHFKPDWKKRGAGYSVRTDVHIAAGLRCVDCHAAGSRAADSRIREKENHQFGKGDDPSGWVRNDLDNTVRTCEDCHIEGWRNAPKATHAWLPPLHMDKLSCQACHIPTRAVKSAVMQASDVFNAAPRISPPAKHIWTFYDQEMNFWNHYGELELFTVADEPTTISRPTLIAYKGKIYPANRVHSSWVGLETDGKPGLDQVLMKDFFSMWKAFRSDPAGPYAVLATIDDENGDGALEINRPEEIDAVLAATAKYLRTTGYPLDSKRLVWVSDDRIYSSGTSYRNLDRFSYEATPYASVYKFSHDIAPARAAIGAGGCTDCHSSNSAFLTGNVLSRPFDEQGNPEWAPNYQSLGLSPFWISMGAARETWIKPLLYACLAALASLLLFSVLRITAARYTSLSPRQLRRISWWFIVVLVLGATWSLATPGLTVYLTFRRFTLDANHFWISALIFLTGLLVTLVTSRHEVRGSLISMGNWLLRGLLVSTAVFGIFMIAAIPGLGAVQRLSYTLFDLGLLLIAAICCVFVAQSVLTVQDYPPPPSSVRI